MIYSLFISHCGESCLNMDMRKFESSEKDESRAQSVDSSKAYSKPRAFDCCFMLLIKLLMSVTQGDNQLIF